MPYGYTDEAWARIDSPTKYRIIQEAQKQAKPKTTTTTPKTTTTTPKTTTTTPKTTTTTPKTTTTTPKTTTTKTTSVSTQKTTAPATSTSATQPTQGSAAKAAATYNPTLTDMNTAANTATSTSGSGSTSRQGPEWEQFQRDVAADKAKYTPQYITSDSNPNDDPLWTKGGTHSYSVVGQDKWGGNVWKLDTQPKDPYADMLAEMERRQRELAEAQAKDPYADMLAETERRQRELAEAQRQSRIAALQKSKETALANLESGLTSAMSTYAGEEAALKPYYYDLRNRTAAQSDIAAKNFAEYMAAQGIRGSAAGLPEIYRNAALQGQIGALTRQEQQAREDIARRRSTTQAEYETQKAGLLNAYESDVAAAMADIDAQTLQNYIDNMRMIQTQRAADLAAQGKTSTGELTLQGRQAQQNELAQQAALLAARYYDDIQAYINTLDPNDPIMPYLYAERQKKIQTEAEKAAAAAAAASEEEQRAWKRAFDLFQSTGRITSAEQAQILGLPMGATVADVDIARMNAATSRMNAQTSAYNAQQRTQQQADQAASQRIQQYADIIDRLYVNTQYDNNGQAIGKTFDPDTVKAYIKNLNQTGQISDDEARQLLGMYGFTF